MPAGKIEIKNGKSIYCVKSLKNQTVDARSVSIINQNGVLGLLRFNAVKNASAYSLEYDVTGLITLREFLKYNVITEHMLKKLLKSIFESLDSVRNIGFNCTLIHMTPDTVMVSPSEWKVYFVYVPFTPAEVVGNIHLLLKSIGDLGNFNKNGDTAYVNRYIQTVKSGVTYSGKHIKDYIRTLSDNPQSFRVNSYDPAISSKEDDEKTVSAFGFGENPPVFASPIADLGKKFWLVSKKSGAKTRITGELFHVGKLEGYNNLVIFNKAVSRKHADFIVEGDACYVVDINSTNGTLVNGTLLAGGEKTLLPKKCLVTFADEEFEFITE